MSANGKEDNNCAKEIEFDPVYYNPDIPIDLDQLCKQVRHYLYFNQIRWSIFAKVVLGVSQSRLSALLAQPTKPWSDIKRRVKAYYQRMQEWMDKRATFGNNPYQIIRKGQEQMTVKKKAVKKRRVRNFFEGEHERQEREEREEQRRALESILDQNVNPTSQLVQESGDFLNEIMLPPVHNFDDIMVDNGVIVDSYCSNSSGYEVFETTVDVHQLQNADFLIDKDSNQTNEGFYNDPSMEKARKNLDKESFSIPVQFSLEPIEGNSLLDGMQRIDYNNNQRCFVNQDIGQMNSSIDSALQQAQPSHSRTAEEILPLTDFYYDDLALDLALDAGVQLLPQQIADTLSKKTSENVMDIVELLDSSMGSIEDSIY